MRQLRVLGTDKERTASIKRLKKRLKAAVDSLKRDPSYELIGQKKLEIGRVLSKRIKNKVYVN